MRLLDFLKESTATTDSAISQMIQNLNALSAFYSGTLLDLVRDQYRRGDHDDMGKLIKRLVNMRKGKWFGDHYLSTSRHRETPHQGLKNAVLALAREPRFQNVRQSLMKLGSFEIGMYRSNINKGGVNANDHAVFNTSGYVDTIIDVAPAMLMKMSEVDSINRERLQTCANRLQQSVNKFHTEANRLHKEWDEEWGKAADVRRQRDEKQYNKQGRQQAVSSQASQANQLVDQILSGVDKRNAHEIRQILARTDNKLQVLQQELQKRGLM